jgi:hypothetical protein
MVVSLIEVDTKLLKNILEEKKIKDLESSEDTSLKLSPSFYQLEKD